ncbi:hypothetical protein BJF78_00120 [Pseudonocardia sp. CNS-139]|nr:hypothetical protein BJF78_00120 [Pseudonocardia sp. CNS-139]
MATGYTAVVCRATGCGRGNAGTVAAQLFTALQDAVRASPQGVLVSTGCLLGRSACAGRAVAPVVLVQACDADRAPVGTAVRVGPLRTAADVATVADWLRAGDLDARLLPAQLLGVHRQVAAAPLN